jgi:hypothetical protein
MHRSVLSLSMLILPLAFNAGADKDLSFEHTSDEKTGFTLLQEQYI